MQHYINQGMVRRNRSLGRWMMFGGLGASLIAVVISFVAPLYIFIALGLMLTGGLTSQIGTALYNRFGRSPRIDEVIDDSLKGLDDRYGVFHFLLGSRHVILGPSGALAIIPRVERGGIAFINGSWFQTPPRRRLSFGSRQRELKDLIPETRRDIRRLERALARHLPDHDPINLADDARLDTGSGTLLTAHRKKVKNLLRTLPKQASLNEKEIRSLAARLTHS
jgi:NAD(P)H-hydrate repair Nnr-like enzyme with NAD(P)H-hydrate dehydratase domain